MKQCTKCEQTKQVENFYNDRNRADGKQPWCSDCMKHQKANAQYDVRYKEGRKTYQREYARRPERKASILQYQQSDIGKKVKRRSKLKLRYGLSELAYKQMIRIQDNKCAVCRSIFTCAKHTHVDHCHTTGKVRGVLCNHCNRALGAVKDSAETLVRLANYLETVVDHRIIPVIIESPYKGNIYVNRTYARACMRDCLLKGEAPYASHLLYTQLGVLDDSIAEERTLGIDAGLEWGKFAAKTVVYTDLGISTGMQYGIDRANTDGRIVEMRTLPNWVEPQPEELAKIAYTAYGDSVGWKNFLGNQMPEYENLPEPIRKAWCAAASALTK